MRRVDRNVEIAGNQFNKPFFVPSLVLVFANMTRSTRQTKPNKYLSFNLP